MNTQETNTFLTIQPGTPRMTSVQLAELTGKKHQHVMRDIRSLIDQQAIGSSNFGLSSYDSEQNKKGPMYTVDFHASLVH